MLLRIRMHSWGLLGQGTVVNEVQAGQGVEGLSVQDGQQILQLS